MKRYIFNILIWIDIGVNAIIFAGSPYETVSSRVGKRRDFGETWACWICGILDKIDPRHCDKSKVPDVGTNSVNWWKCFKFWR